MRAMLYRIAVPAVSYNDVGEMNSVPEIFFGLGRCEQEGGALGQGHNPGRVVFDWADDMPRLQCSFLLKSAPYAEIGNPTSRILVLFAQGLGVRFAVRIKEFLSALLPRRFEFGRCDIPIRPAFLGDSAEILAEILQSRPAPEPVAVVNLMDDQTGLEHDRVGNHRIVERICVLGDVEVLLDFTPRVRKERPVGTDSAAIFIRLCDIIGANRDQPAIANL